MLVLSVVVFSACGSDAGPGQDLGAGDTVVSDVDANVPDGQVDESIDRDVKSDVVDVTDVVAVDVAEVESGDVVDDVVADVVMDIATDVATEVVDTVQPDVHCESEPDFDYTCSEFRPETCPGGLCVAKYCIGPELDPNRWDSCSDRVCDPCEQPCISDCGPYDAPTGNNKNYTSDTTLTVYVHGFELYSEDELAAKTYGDDTGCGMTDNLKWFGPDRPCSTDAGGSTASNQYTSLEYYGQKAASWISSPDRTEIEKHPEEGVEALQRYSLITAKFIRHKLKVSGATNVNLLCHSMGCLIIRNMIERNMENLASEDRFTRWVTVSGALSGAREANFYDNPQVQELAASVGLSSADFILLQPEVIKDKVLVWDHKLFECNNPMFREMLIHHICSDDPRNAAALNLPVLNYLIADVPNDGVIYTPDMYFHAMSPMAARHTPRGYTLKSSRSFMFVDHNAMKVNRAAALLATAGMYGKRRVTVTIDRIVLNNDLEKDSVIDFSEGGNAPAEIVPEIEVKFNPYVMDTFAEDLVIHKETAADRVSGFFWQTEGETLNPDYVLFEGPVLDEMTEISLSLKLLEADSYPAQGINEQVLGIGQDTKELATWSGQISLTSGATVSFSNSNVEVRLKVRVVDLY